MKTNAELTLPAIFAAEFAIAGHEMTPALLGETAVVIQHELRGLSPAVQAAVLTFLLMNLLGIQPESIMEVNQ